MAQGQDDSSFETAKTPILVLIVLLLLVYVILPVAFKSSERLRRFTIFWNYIYFIKLKRLSNPEAFFGCKCARSFMIESENGKIGAWHIFPEDLLFEWNQEELPPEMHFPGDNFVVLYLHGAVGTRGDTGRVRLYKFLSCHPYYYHVLAIDYRGFGDSTGKIPDVRGTAIDALSAYHWLLGFVDSKRIIVWGHSLGTALATYMLSQVEEVYHPKLLVLEAPFNNMIEAFENHPLTRIYFGKIYKDYFFYSPLRETDIETMNTEENILKVKSPIRMAHGEDDIVVPVKLAKKLEEAAKKISERPVELEVFPKNLRYGHLGNHKDRKVIDVLLENHIRKRRSRTANRVTQ